jgi:predicted NodU family carbamoyl transferase
MMLAMAMRAEARATLAAGIDPEDGKGSPQIPEEPWNPEYSAAISEVEGRTGVGAVVSTPFRPARRAGGA